MAHRYQVKINIVNRRFAISSNHTKVSITSHGIKIRIEQITIPTRNGIITEVLEFIMSEIGEYLIQE